MRRKIAIGILTVLYILICSACMPDSIDELYSLPELSIPHVQLQKMISQEISAGSEFSAPNAGSFRQSVQLYDIHNNGADTAFAFFRTASQSLKVCVYELIDDVYSEITSIEGEGTSIWRIDFSDLDGDGTSELIITWQLSSGLRILKAYQIGDMESSIIYTANCTDFQVVELDEDTKPELLLLRSDAQGIIYAQWVRFPEKGDPLISSVPLSLGMESVERVKMGKLSDGKSAVFIEGKFQDGVQAGAEAKKLVTDVLTPVDGELKNISLDVENGNSRTVRMLVDHAYAVDVDGDKIMEIPEIKPLYVQVSAYMVMDWYRFNTEGEKIFSLSTYHSAEGWYLMLPESWRENLTVRRDDILTGERGVVFSYVDPDTEEITDFLVIYTLTGDNRKDRARLPGRFVLKQEGATIFAARVLKKDGPWGNTLGPDEIIRRFKLIRTEWSTGAL